MRASRASTEFKLLGLGWVLMGIAAGLIVSTKTIRESGTFEAVLAGTLAVATVAHAYFTLRGMRRAQPAPEAIVVNSPWQTVWRQVLPGLAPIAIVVYSLTLPQQGSFVLVGASAALGTTFLIEAWTAARLERDRGTKLLRLNSRYFLAH